MADEETQDQQEQPKKKSPIKMIAIVGGIMVIEAVAVLGFTMFAGGKPTAAEAGIEGADQSGLEQLVEISLVADKFQNLQSGRVWLWDTEVYLKVRSKDQEFIEKELERRRAEVTQGVAQIIRKASQNQLKEPGLETLTRQFSAYAHSVFGTDAEGENHVQSVIIPKCRGFPADY